MREKSLDFKILSTLFKNSCLSHEQLAEELGSSESTVTPRRAKVEERLIEGYTIIPNAILKSFRLKYLEDVLSMIAHVRYTSTMSVGSNAFLDDLLNNV